MEPKIDIGGPPLARKLNFKLVASSLCVFGATAAAAAERIALQAS